MLNQNKAYEKFKRLKVGALFMEMGTGKTKVAVELVNYNKVDLLIYLTPFSTKNNLEKELKKWKVNCEYLIVGYETISSSDRTFLEVLNKMENKKCFVIADESIFIKNEETKRFNRVLKIRKKSDYALVLNGTPLTKNEWDLYNQMEFLSPLIIDMSREEFLNTFFKKIIYKKVGEKKNEFYKFSEVNADALYKMISPYIFKSKLDFNKKETINYNYIEYLDTEYQTVKEYHLDNFMKEYNSSEIINMFTKLNVISSTYKEKNDEIVKYIKGKRLIVFCNYIEEAKYIHSKVKSYLIIGETKNRSEIIEEFKKDNKPLIMTYGIGSYGLNLQFINEIVYSSLNFDFAKIKQSKYRIKRIGQEQDIKYTYFLTNLGINNLIMENLQKKESLEEIIKEKIEKGGNKWLKSI